MPCKYGKPMSDYSRYINKEILQCEQIRELFMTKKDVDIGLLIVSFHFNFVKRNLHNTQKFFFL